MIDYKYDTELYFFKDEMYSLLYVDHVNTAYHVSFGAEPTRTAMNRRARP